MPFRGLNRGPNGCFGEILARNTISEEVEDSCDDEAAHNANWLEPPSIGG
jgi:hypothetical protein